MQNEEFDLNAVTVIITYNDGEISELPYDENTMTIVGFNSSEICEKQTLKLTYNGLEADFEISIIEAVKPLTTTTTRVGTNYTRFYVNFEEEISDAVIVISVTDEKGTIENLITADCDGDSSYILTIPSLTNSKIAKVFVWGSLDTMIPLGITETVNIK